MRINDTRHPTSAFIKLCSTIIASGAVTTLAGSGYITNGDFTIGGYADGVSSSARFNQPKGIAVSPDGLTLYVSDAGNSKIRSIDIGKLFPTYQLLVISAFAHHTSSCRKILL